MNELRAELLKALRSPAYRQTRGCLRFGDAYCATGVACDVMAHNGLGRWEHGEAGWSFIGPSGSWHNVSAPTEASALFGFDPATMIRANDHGMPLAEIADIVEANSDDPSAALFTASLAFMEAKQVEQWGFLPVKYSPGATSVLEGIMP